MCRNLIRLSAHCAALLGILLAAGSTRAQDVPFTGVVTQDDVEVRAGAGRTFYVVGTLPKDTLVKVDEVIFGWHKIQPPRGTASYVSKAFVNRQGRGTIGIVHSDRTKVRAANIDPSEESYRRQVDLMSGDRVQIIGEEGDFYKIVPPKGAFVYLPPGALRRATDTELAKAVAAERGTAEPEAPAEAKVPAEAPKDPGTEASKKLTARAPAQPVRPEAVKQEPQPIAPRAARPTEPKAQPQTAHKELEPTDARAEPPSQTTVVPPEDRDPKSLVGNVSWEDEPVKHESTPTQESRAEVAPEPQPDAPPVVEKGGFSARPRPRTVNLKSLEAQFTQAMDLPLEDQPVDELLEGYRALSSRSNLSAPDRRVVEARLGQLKRNAGLQDALGEIADVREQINQDQVQVTLVQEAVDAAPTYDAVGQLLASAVYDGVRMPRLFRLVEPSTMRTIIYVRPSLSADVTSVLGRVVGIIGEVQDDQGLKLRVVEAERIDALQATAIGSPLEHLVR